jgi:hypothetical protein
MYFSLEKVRRNTDNQINAPEERFLPSSKAENPKKWK